VTPIDEHTALVAAVTEMLRLAEAVAMLDGPWTAEPHYAASPGCRCGSCYEENPSGWEIPELEALRGHGAFPVFREESDARYIAAHDPSWAIRSHREALERLNRHRPTLHNVDDPPYHLGLCPTCAYCPPWPCPEVAGLHSAYNPSDPAGEQT
jgi:hypothetical protein